MDNLKQELNSIVLKINQDNCAIKYCVYRTALKLVQLQDVFQLADISSSVLFNAVENYCADNDSFLNAISHEVLTFNQLNQFVSSLLQSAGVLPNLHSDKFVQLLTTLIFATFHDVIENKVALIAVVLFFIILSNEDLKVKYMQLFDLYAAPLGMLTRSRTGLLLTHLIRLTDIVGESATFSKIKSSVTSCFEGVLGNMVSQQQFIQWVLREPQSIVWLPTMHRLNVAKSSVHAVECTTCKVRPIVGLRFQCLKCIDYNSCQVCFLTQQNSSRSHKLHHPRQEYCLPAGSKEKLSAFARTLRNIVTKRYKHKPLSPSYLPISQDNITEHLSSAHQASRDEIQEENTNFGDLSHLAEEERKKLEKIVKKLKTENKKVSGTVHLLETSKNELEYVEDDNAVLQSRLDTVTLQNQSLQAELDNLKCVVFADNFMQQSPLLPRSAGFDEVNSSDGQASTEVTAPVPKPQKKKRTKHNREDSTRNISTETTAEEQLAELLDKFQVKLLNNTENSPQQPLIFEQVCLVACEVRLKLNELIEEVIIPS